MRGESLYKIVHIAPQEGAAAKTDFRRTVRKDIRRFYPHQIRVRDRINGHAGNHTHPQSQSDVRFDNIGIGRSEDNPWRQPGAIKSGVQF